MNEQNSQQLLLSNSFMGNFQPNMALFLFTPFKLCIRSVMTQFDSYTLWDGFVVLQKEMAWIVPEDPLNFQIFTQVLACFVLNACNSFNQVWPFQALLF